MRVGPRAASPAHCHHCRPTTTPTLAGSPAPGLIRSSGLIAAAGRLMRILTAFSPSWPCLARLGYVTLKPGPPGEFGLILGRGFPPSFLGCPARCFFCSFSSAFARAALPARFGGLFAVCPPRHGDFSPDRPVAK